MEDTRLIATTGSERPGPGAEPSGLSRWAVLRGRAPGLWRTLNPARIPSLSQLPARFIGVAADFRF
jgi:hypothetical protein